MKEIVNPDSASNIELNENKIHFQMNINITPIYVRFRWILQVYRFIGMTSSK